MSMSNEKTYTTERWWDLSDKEREGFTEQAKELTFHQFMDNNPDISESIATALYPDVDFSRPGDRV